MHPETCCELQSLEIVVILSFSHNYFSEDAAIWTVIYESVRVRKKLPKINGRALTQSWSLGVDLRTFLINDQHISMLPNVEDERSSL